MFEKRPLNQSLKSASIVKKPLNLLSFYNFIWQINLNYPISLKSQFHDIANVYILTFLPTISCPKFAFGEKIILKKPFEDSLIQFRANIIEVQNLDSNKVTVEVAEHSQNIMDKKAWRTDRLSDAVTSWAAHCS